MTNNYPHDYAKSLFLISWVFLIPTAVAHGVGEKPEAARAFYRDKSITWLVGSTPGSTTDLIARTLAPFLAKHTGAPVILQTRPEGQGTAAFNHVYNRAKPDGLTLAWHIAATHALNSLVGTTGIQYDLIKFSWLGVVSPVGNTFMAYQPRFKSLDDVRRAAGPLRWGLTRPGGNSHFQGITLSSVLGLKVRFVPGYRGGGAIRQALISGEIDVTASGPAPYSSVIQEGLVTPLIHMGFRRHPAVPDTPTVLEVVKKLPSPFDVWFQLTEAGWFLVTSPGVPKERFQFLRQALKQAMTDPEFIELAKRRNIVLSSLSPDQAKRIVRDFVTQSPAAQKELRQFLGK